MRCRNCPARTKNPQACASWRNDQLCGTCAHKIFPKKYSKNASERKSIHGKEDETYGRYANIETS